MASFGSQKYARAAGGDGVAISGFAGLQAALSRIEDGTAAEVRAKILEIGERVALVAASDAPRITGELQHSIKVASFSKGASVYSNAVYGGAINYGAWSKGRGPHIKRASASHYMDRAVQQTAPWVATEVESVMDWLMTTFLEG